MSCSEKNRASGNFRRIIVLLSSTISILNSFGGVLGSKERRLKSELATYDDIAGLELLLLVLKTLYGLNHSLWMKVSLDDLTSGM